MSVSHPRSSLDFPQRQRLPCDISNADQVESYTSFLCRDIKRVFHRRQNDDSDYPTTRRNDDDGADAKAKELITDTRLWVERMANLGAKVCAATGDWHDNTKFYRRQAVVDALALLLRTLDDVDIGNLEYLSSRRCNNNKSKSKKNKSNGQQTKQPQPSFVMTSKKRRRRRLPRNVRSNEIVQAMHETEVIDSEDEDYNSSTLILSNSDRHQRAKRSHVESQHSCSMMGISMKAVMNVRVVSNATEDHDVDSSQGLITTLIHDAAVLRRDLYRHLAAFDVAEIKAIVEQSKRCEVKSNATNNGVLSKNIKDLTSALVRRITVYPASPSMRLSAIIALDSLRELKLSDWGYRCILGDLLDVNASWSLQFYAEIISECHAYEKPMRLLCLSKLMYHAVEAHKLLSNDDCDVTEPTVPLLLRAISHIMVRRQNILSSFHQDVVGSSVLIREIDGYKRVCDSMSVHFGSISNWIFPTMPSDVRDCVISALQAEGILSLFCCNDSDDEERSQSLQTIEEYPYSQYFSLRAAHERMGPCVGFFRLLSHPAAYQHAITLPESPALGSSSQLSTEENILSQLSSASDDILTIIFSFLSYRSLARASQCCVAWRRASNERSLWVGLYFRKFENRNRILNPRPTFEEELAPDEIVVNDDLEGRYRLLSVAARQQLALSKEDYDWKYIFKSKYAIEKRCKAKTCHVIGCSYIIRRADHFESHMKR